MLVIILKIIELLFLLIGVIMIYDARVLAQELFSYCDQNQASLGIKLFGFSFCLIGTFSIYFIKWL